MKVAVITASHERMVPLGIVHAHLPPEWHAVVVLSPGEDGTALLERPHTHVFHYANQPLGLKWQHAVDRARDLRPDVLVIAGSDDVLLVKPAAFEDTMTRYDMAGPRSFLAYNGKRHYAFAYKAHVAMPIGSGRMYRADLLDRFGWRLFDTGRDNMLDDMGYRNAMDHSARHLVQNNIPGLQVVALKGPWDCKNPLEKYLRGKNLTVDHNPHVRHRVTYQF